MPFDEKFVLIASQIDYIYTRYKPDEHEVVGDTPRNPEIYRAGPRSICYGVLPDSTASTVAIASQIHGAQARDDQSDHQSQDASL